MLTNIKDCTFKDDVCIEKALPLTDTNTQRLDPFISTWKVRNLSRKFWEGFWFNQQNVKNLGMALHLKIRLIL